MFKRKLYISVLMLFTLLFIAACGNESGTDGSGGNDDQFLDFITGDPEGTWAAIGTGISDRVNESLDGIEVVSKPGSGSVGNPEAVSIEKGDIGMSYNPFLLKAENGEAPFSDKMTNLRAVASLTPTVVHFIQNSDMKIDSLEELISTQTDITLGIPPEGQGSNYIGNMIFESQGIESIEDTLNDWGGDIYYGNMSNLTDAWSNRQIDSIISTLNVPGSAIEESMAASEGKLMNIGDELANVLINEQGFEPYTIPSGTYNNQEKDVETVGLSIIVFARDDVSDDVIYELTKTIYENEDYLANVHSSFENFNADNMADNLTLEVHPGAEKFYQEKGLMD
ncbi:TAXI family TRAP transporter solute-binding subunit [Lentibacillus amyloliquefaciens]|uniref:C4-dicarboxylate ABC transporter substrate-binding protein n=1 Tax=Lentibacillus amyloliquefaciens TaxID=1472767 RepID=A0A0U4FRS0_9BACI|nr:TAXI family TRAP transporter solute-binding subunit [Lentibacillus amyloliquefaciens]ALX50404.1 hypothetical protein AOX59_18560 [Lentibacillus amyloliquefaciens]